MIKTNFKIITIFLIILALFSTNVLAIPGQSHKFFGTVTINGQAAPDGTTVTAKIGTVLVASTTTSGGKFGYPLYSFGVPDSDNNRAGKEVRFFVNDVDTGTTVTFCNACYNLCDFYTPNCTPLSLAVTIQQQSGGSPSGGGGGGGGVPTVTTQTNQTTTATQGCQEEWVCSDWSECKDGIQTRTCTDSKNCGTRNNEPFTSQPCSAAQRKEAEQKSQVPSITAFFLGLTAVDWATAIIVGIIIAVVIIFIAKRKSKKK